MDFLTQNELDRVKRFANSDTFNAVKKVLLHAIYNQGVIKKGEEIQDRNFIYGLYMDDMGRVFQKSSEDLGKEVKAIIEGVSFLENGLKAIKSLAEEPKKVEPKPNEAR